MEYMDRKEWVSRFVLFRLFLICGLLSLGPLQWTPLLPPLSPTLHPGARPALAIPTLVVCGLAGDFVVFRGCMERIARNSSA